ncbi:MAG: chemotaxis protein CheR, partial [Treponemataceae bacterium]|nr:chemotaxis protein CheR [Treponemataceae bacterium]
MQNQSYFIPSVKELTKEEFNIIANYIETNVGIKMPETKRIMMQARLARRLKALNMSSFGEYIDYVFARNNNDELILMIDTLTTNKTEFFREATHFDFLSKAVLPEMAASGRSTVKIWSAGCSSGEEPYTISMVVSEYIKNNRNQLTNFSVTGTDIS